MRILYVALRYDYGKPEHGLSFEHYNFYDTLRQMKHDIIYFDFYALAQEHGQNWMNRRLREIVKSEQPALMFTVLALEDRLQPEVVRDISENADTVTVNWFCDDHYRFHNYSKYWAPCYNWVVTTARGAIADYARLGYRNVVKSQWASNHCLYHRMDLPLLYDVTFIGRPHSDRVSIINSLRRANISVHTWGEGWNSGRLSQAEMIRVFNQSRINLNLTSASCPINLPDDDVSMSSCLSVVKRCFDYVPHGSMLKRYARPWFSTVVSSARQSSFRNGVSAAAASRSTRQIKGRNFEIPGCGGFLLTEYADDIESYYDIGKEIVCFDGVDDLIANVRYYLKHENQRAEIARAGYDRTLADHTYERRFEQMFQKIGLA